MTTAYDYARGIADYLRGLDMIQDELLNNDPSEYSTATRRYCDDLGIESNHDDHNVGAHWLKYDALDVWADVEWRHDRSTVRSVTALRTTGGPHCEVVWDGNRDDLLVVHVSWRSDRSTFRAECATVAEAMAIVWDNAHQSVGGPTD